MCRRCAGHSGGADAGGHGQLIVVIRSGPCREVFATGGTGLDVPPSACWLGRWGDAGAAQCMVQGGNRASPPPTMSSIVDLPQWGFAFLEIKSIRSLCLLLKAKARQAELPPRQAPFAHGEGMGHPWVCAGIGCPSLGGGSP